MKTSDPLLKPSANRMTHRRLLRFLNTPTRSAASSTSINCCLVSIPNAPNANGGGVRSEAKLIQLH